MRGAAACVSGCWPIGMGRDFLGTYDLFADALLLLERGVHDRVVEPVLCNGLDDPTLPRLLPKTKLCEGVVTWRKRKEDWVRSGGVALY